MIKQKYDKKVYFTLVGFILVGVLLFATIFARNSMEIEKSKDALADAKGNTPMNEQAYYGSEAVKLLGQVYDKEGNLLDVSSLKEETSFFSADGKEINPPTVSPSEYEKAVKGISYEDLKSLIGGEGEITGEVDKPGDEFYTVCYYYYGDKANSSASFIFQGDRLKSKTNTGIIQKEDK
ncbi:MAG: hypothetical protein IJC89_02130 [Clostridia bacterium]|nr:hypothetical protein [Clostridia bacterium]